MMLVPLLASIKANEEAYYPFPALDENSYLKINEKDGTPIKYLVNFVGSMIDKGETAAFDFGMGDFGADKWEVLLTDERIAVWNPFSLGLLGKPKIKLGRATAGQILYKCITSLIIDKVENYYNLFIGCARHTEGVKSYFQLKTTDRSTFMQLLLDLRNKVDKDLEKRGCKLKKDETSGSSVNDLIDLWDSYPDGEWEKEEEELSILIPSSEIYSVPDDRRF